MHSRLEALRNGVIVSVQASGDEPLNKPEILEAMALSAINGGARALRMANTESQDNIKPFKKHHPDILVIGLTKPEKIPGNAHELVYITPTFDDVKSLVASGADAVAFDATNRPRPGGETLPDIILQSRKEFPHVYLMADISTLEEGVYAAELGLDMISTTLSGYTTATRNSIAVENDTPDFTLLEELVKSPAIAKTNIPVILEGRIWTPTQVKTAFELGAFAVVIGSAITRPHLITERFCQV